MNAQLKSGVESALIALLAAAVCLWMLVSASQGVEPSVSRILLCSFGLAAALAAHVVFMMQVVRRTGRNFWLWFIAIVLFAPIGTAVLLALVYSESEPANG